MVITFNFYMYLGLLLPCVFAKVYRSDYEYYDRTDAFYKLNIDATSYKGAQKICAVEGAELITLASDLDIIQIHRMIKVFSFLVKLVWIKNDRQSRESAEEHTIIHVDQSAEAQTEATGDRTGHCDVVTWQGEVESASCNSPLPFVCKLQAKDAPYDRECNVHGKNYHRAEALNSCYKMSQMGYSWNQAYEECNSEGAHLVILNSQAEHDHVQQLMLNSTRLEKVTEHWFFHAGFRAEWRKDGVKVFKTIFNQTLEEAGYSTWADGEPIDSRTVEYCGSLFKYDGKLNDIACARMLGFICEKEL